MSLNTNTSFTATLSDTVQSYYDKKLLLRAQLNMVFYEHGEKRPVPQNAGRSVNFRRFEPFSPSTTPLTEGVVPNGQTMTLTDVAATLRGYGSYVAVSDYLSLTAIDDIVNGALDVLGQQGGETVDKLVETQLLTGTQVVFAGGASARTGVAYNKPLTFELVRKAVTMLKVAGAPMFNRDGRRFYVAICNPYATADLQADSAWQSVNTYAAPDRIFNGEIGMMYGVVFVESTLASVISGGGAVVSGTTSADVNCTYIFGQQAYACTSVDSAQHLYTTVKPAGSGGSSDPLDQISTIGWKVPAFAAKLLNNSWLVRVESGMSPVTSA